jgi:hypothetical protein
MSDDDMEGGKHLHVIVNLAVFCLSCTTSKFTRTRGPCADYGFEYSDEEVEEEDVDIENQYYNSKGELLLLQLCFIRLINLSCRDAG